MENQQIARQSAHELPQSTIEAARVKRCRIHFCTPMTSGLDERESWMVQQGSSMKFLASLPDVVTYVEELAPMKPRVMKPVGCDAESAGHTTA